ncbi:MAG: ribosome biogenesis/translation initiation ATPase RLI [Candidatus Anstonellales archaeon]
MKKKRIAVIDRELCTREKCGYVCMNVCPVNRMGEECIVKEEETSFPLINELLCIGCGICVKKCPVQAITVINLAKEKDDPIFQYGPNSFRLYGLPLPKKGVVGIVGRNGVGKSTSIKLLSKQLIPNFGEYSKKYSWAEVSTKLSPELKEYFSSTQKVSVKPQNVLSIAEAFDGNVEELIRKMDERGAFENAVKIFGLEKILKRKLKQLSGGELQKVALAAAYVKDATVYFFDEPSTYLDIGERMSIGIFMKNFSEEKSVMLVEHDLTILDYMSDYVYVFYGEENAYGVVSNVKPVRRGINEYLSGFLSDENIRFRDHEIKISKYSESEVSAPTLFSYDEIRVELDGFSLHAEKGEIKKGEIIGIVGRNALGKTTFAKSLSASKNITISYKPQYIKAENAVVRDVFSSRKLLPDIFEEAKNKLGVGRLLEKNLTELSGGELQRVAIVLALSTEADLYLFDEPTGFLDVEQRLAFSELLRKVIDGQKKAAFVVDHDVVFIDSVASRLIVFTGEPSVSGRATSPMSKKDGMNLFLKTMGITMRRDKDTGRPRINKPESVLDREQKKNNAYFYSE